VNKVSNNRNWCVGSSAELSLSTERSKTGNDGVQEPLSPVKQADAKTTAGVVTKKDASQWCDVGIMKGTTCVVSYYHLTSDVAQGNGEVCSIILQP